MSLFIGITFICLAILWLTLLWVGGRNPNRPWYASDWILADVQVPLMMLLVAVGIWLISRTVASHLIEKSIGLFEFLASVGAVTATVLIIRQMKVGLKLKQFAEMQADDSDDASQPDSTAGKLPPLRKLPWQVRLYLAEKLGFDLSSVRTMRCVVREAEDPPGWLRFIAFYPDQAIQRGVATDDFDTLAGHPELAIVSGMYGSDSHSVTIDQTHYRRVA